MVDGMYSVYDILEFVFWVWNVNVIDIGFIGNWMFEMWVFISFKI